MIEPNVTKLSNLYRNANLLLY